MTPADMVVLDDGMEKNALFDKLREKLFGPRPRDNEPTPVLEDKSKPKAALGRLGDFLRGFMGGETWRRKSHAMGVFPGPAKDEEQLEALSNVVDQLGGYPLTMQINDSGWGGYFPDENLVELTQGQIGTAYHEGGHVVGIESMSPAVRDAYIDLMQASYKYGPKSGLALLPNALLDPPGKRRGLSKWGPLAALAPSLPMLFEEGRANWIGGKAAKQHGHFSEFLNEALPSYGGYVAQASAVPLGLYMIHKAKEKRLADAQAAARAKVEEQMASPDFPKEARVAIGFADELEKFGGIKTLMGGIGIGLLAPGIAKGQIMSGAQNFNHPGRAPRYGSGHITSQRGPAPIIEKIRFNPILNKAVDVGKGGASLARDAVGTATDYYTGDFGGFKKAGAVNSPYGPGRRRFGMSSKDQELLLMAEALHSRVGGVSPDVARVESQLLAAEREVARRPVLERLLRALKTGELAREKELPWLGYREAPMEQVVSAGKPLTQEQVALAGLAPKASPLQRMRGILGERQAARTAAHAVLRR